MPVCGNYLFFELPKKIVLNPKDGDNMGFIPKNSRHFSTFFDKASKYKIVSSGFKL